MKIHVYVASLNQYSEGKVKGKWITLPTDSDVLAKEVEELSEYAIFSYEAPFYIGELDDLDKLNDLMKELTILGLNFTEKELEALLESVDNLEEAVSLLRDGRVRFYDLETEYPRWSDLAEMLVYYYDYMQVPDRLKDYIDCEQVGRDLETSGNWYLSKNGVAVEQIR